MIGTRDFPAIRSWTSGSARPAAGHGGFGVESLFRRGRLGQAVIPFHRKIRDKRECPKDWSPLQKEMRESFLRKVEVDVCPKCRGVFLDENEVAKLTGSHRLHEILSKYTGLNSNVQVLCPNCGGLMEAEDAGDVRVEVCLDCFGVWLDAGELERLATMDRAAFRHLTPEEMEGYRKKKEIRREEHEDAIRNLFLGLRRS